jgi:hypothetical protein
MLTKAFRTTTLKIETPPVRTDGKSWDISSEGYLTVTAYATRVGIFDYYDAKGKLRKEYRSEKEVFDPASISTLALQPHTRLHPDKMLDNTNASGLLKGIILPDIQIEGQFLKVTIKIFDGPLIQEIISGKLRELSCGYYCDTVEEPGEWNGEKYNARQINIRYNHISSVPKGRAGSDVAINFDEQAEYLNKCLLLPEASGTQDDKSFIIRCDSSNNAKSDDLDIRFDNHFYFDNISNSQEDSPQMFTIKIDGKDVEVTKEVYDAWTAQTSTISTLTKEKTDAVKTRDEIKGKYDQALVTLTEIDQKKADENKKLFIDTLKPYIKADEEQLKKLDTLTPRQLGELVIISNSENKDLDLSGETDDYIKGRVDAITSAPIAKKPAEKKVDHYSDFLSVIKDVAPPTLKTDAASGDVNDKSREDEMKTKADAWKQPIGYAATLGGTK